MDGPGGLHGKLVQWCDKGLVVGGVAPKRMCPPAHRWWQPGNKEELVEAQFLCGKGKMRVPPAWGWNF